MLQEHDCKKTVKIRLPASLQSHARHKQFILDNKYDRCWTEDSFSIRLSLIVYGDCDVECTGWPKMRMQRLLQIRQMSPTAIQLHYHTGIVNFWVVRNRIPTFKNANNTKQVEVIHFCHFCYTPVTPVGAVVNLYCCGWQHGAVVMLFHPCADRHQVATLRRVVTSCLRRHIITPSRQLSRTQVGPPTNWLIAPSPFYVIAVARSKVHRVKPCHEVMKLFVPTSSSKQGNYRRNPLNGMCVDQNRFTARGQRHYRLRNC